MVKANHEAPGQLELRDDFERALLSTTRARLHEPPPVLLALAHMLVKTKRIAKVLGVQSQLVSAWMSGKQGCPTKYRAPLLDLLRNAIEVGRQTCARAERKELLWGRLEFPGSSIAFMRQRIAEAEKVLKEEEAGQ
jgi:hypothetical protein